jgi:hypothetical protein
VLFRSQGAWVGEARRRGAAGPGPPPAGVAVARQQFRGPDRSGLPAPDRYARLVTGAGERLIAATETTRGCKHLCRHCPIVPVYNGRFRVVQRDVVLADIRQQVAAGATHVTFGDPDFFNGPAHSMAVVRALHEEFPHVSYDVTIKIEHLVRRDDLIPALKETGCLFVTSAVEAFDEPTLDALEKHHTRRDIEQVVERFRQVGLQLSPTFVPFTPWTTTLSYLGLLDTVAELDLVDAVAPVQYAIRLLIPRGSRLLELPFVQSCIQPFDPVSLAFPWVHPDPAVDELQASILKIVDQAVTQEADRRDLFADIWSAVAVVAGCPGRRPVRTPGPAGRVIPHVTEPWYCCAEPTERQLAAGRAADGDQAVSTARPPSAPGAPPPALPASPELIQQVRHAAFVRLLEGEAATVGYLATQLQVPAAAAAEAVESLVRDSRAIVDSDGRVVGAAGLSLVPTAHQLRVSGGGAPWCWCAWDALGIASALRLTGCVSTACGACGRPLVVEVSDGEPALSSPEHGYLPPHVGSPLSCFCPYALLFCSAEHLASWRAALPDNVSQGGHGLPITEYAAVARLGWTWAADDAQRNG